MERLTKIYPSGAWGITGELDDAILRLAAYENTGLEPEDCAAYKKFEDNLCASGVPFSRIIELVNAEKEGRITIRPLVRTCPQCHRNHLVARTDGKFYYCFGCKTQFTESEIREERP